MKKKILFTILLGVAICSLIVMLYFLIDYCTSSWSYYNYLLSEEGKNLLLSNWADTIDRQHEIVTTYTVLCVLDCIALCGCIISLIIIAKSDINFIKKSVVEKFTLYKAKRKELQLKKESQKKSDRIAELEQELKTLKKEDE